MRLINTIFANGAYTSAFQHLFNAEVKKWSFKVKSIVQGLLSKEDVNSITKLSSAAAATLAAGSLVPIITPSGSVQGMAREGLVDVAYYILGSDATGKVIESLTPYQTPNSAIATANLVKMGQYYSSVVSAFNAANSKLPLHITVEYTKPGGFLNLFHVKDTATYRSPYYTKNRVTPQILSNEINKAIQYAKSN